MFGADVLGFRFNNHIPNEVNAATGVSVIRWPGGIIADARNANWINDDGTYVYDLANDGVMRKLDANGNIINKDDLYDVLADAAAAGLGFNMLVPTERFITVSSNGIVTIDFVGAESVVRAFLEKLASGDYGTVPNNFTLQLGHEYYSGALIGDFKGISGISDEAAQELYVSSLGKLYNSIASEIAKTTDDLNTNGSNLEGIVPHIAVQMGRLQLDTPSDPFSGSFGDAAVFANQFDAAGIDAVDTLLWQRYVQTYASLDDGLSEPSNGHLISDAVNVWETRAADLGFIGKQFDILAGSSIASLTREEARNLYEANTGFSVSNAIFYARTDENFETDYQARLENNFDYGAQLPSAIIQLFSELAGAGVDAVTAYTMELLGSTHAGKLTTQTANGYGGNPNGYTQILAGGSIFKLLSENIVGKQVLNGYQNNSRSADININAFEDENEIVFYASVNDITGSYSTDISIAGSVYDYYSVEVTSLTTYVESDWRDKYGVLDLTSAANFGSGFDQSAEATLYSLLLEETLVPVEIAQGVTLNFTQDYEIIRVVFEMAHLGTMGNDILDGDIKNNLIKGLEGNDTLIGGIGDDTLYGEVGNDTLDGGIGDDTLDGGDDNDTATYTDALNGVDVYLQFTGIETGEGVDTLIGIENLIGSTFGDHLIGDISDNILSGGAGNDIMKGKGGTDVFYGGDGDDNIYGDAGNDMLYGDASADILFGMGGLDQLFGGDDGDFLYGGQGNDTVYGDVGDDVVKGNTGQDNLFGGAGVDDLRGGASSDFLLDGGADNDFLFGEGGADTLNGGAGNDALSGGFGGGVGDTQADVFIFADAASGSGGFDRIKDFENGLDTMDLTAFGLTDFTTEVEILAMDVVGGLRINFGGGDVLFVENFLKADFDVTDVLLV
jgi:Ca2+-binding RTX toxin-like protein